MTATTTPPADTATAMQGRSLTHWALRRALIGLVIFLVAVGGSAWLLHASIDPTAEAPVEISSPSSRG